MTFHAPVVVANKHMSVTVLSDREEFTESMSQVLSPSDTEFNGLESFLGTLSEDPTRIASPADGVLLVDADPVTPRQIEAIRQLRATCGEATLIFALVPEHVSFVQARDLQNAGADDVLPASITSDDLKHEVERHRNQRRAESFPEGGTPGNIIAVTQARGGVGSTTAAVNVACGLAHKRRVWRKKEQGKRVAFVDLNIQFGDAGAFFDIEDNGGMSQLLEEAAAPDSHLLKSIMQRHSSGVDVLAAPVKFMPLHAARPEAIDELMNGLQKNYDYVVVELPHAMVDWVEPIVYRAALLMLVTDTSVPCIRQTRRIIDFFKEDVASLPVHLVVNREKKPLVKSEHLREAERVLDTPFANWLPDNPRVARRAVDLGNPIVEGDARSDLGKALQKLTASIEAATAPATAAAN